MKLSRRHLFASLVVLGALVLSYLRTDEHVIAEEHERFDSSINLFLRTDVELSRDLLKIRCGLLEDYDAFPRLIGGQKRTMEGLQTYPTFVTGPERQRIEQKVRELSQLVAQKEELLEEFKSQHAILQNSTRYFSAASDELLRRMAENEADREVATLANEFIRQVLVYSLFSTDDLLPKIRQSINKLEQAQLADQHDGANAVLLSSLLRHAEAIISRQSRLEEVTTQLEELPTTPRAEELLTFYTAQFSGTMQAADHSRTILHIACSLLVLGIGYTVYALHAANTHLERRVQKRTSDLSRKNEELEAQIAERERVETALGESEQRFRQMAETIEDVFWMASPGCDEMLYLSPAFERVWGCTRGRVFAEPKAWMEAILPEDRPLISHAFARNAAGQNFDVEYRIVRPDKSIRWIRDRGFPVFDESGNVIRVCGLAGDITRRKEADAELESAQKELLAASHQAGMAEVATSVLHNVGNVLNSVNISLGIATEKVGRLKAAGLGRVAALLNEHATDLPAFFTGHPQGVRLPKFLEQLAGHFAADQCAVLEELRQLRTNIEHINEIVSMQQGFATSGGIIETLPLEEVIEDALRINAAAFERHGTRVVRAFDSSLPPVPIDRNKMLLILVNLIRNAKHACNESGITDKQLTVRTTANEHGRVRITVADNGIGIPPENLTRIFEHGFTTRRDGHGFGLHSSALAASEMGGSLRAQSEGPNRGAAFTLELPLAPSP